MKATTSPRGLRATRKAPGTASHQACTSASCSAGWWRATIAAIAGRSSGRGGLDRVVLDRRREERLTHERLVDQLDHVGQRGPARRAGGASISAADLAPGVAAVGAVADRVGRAQQGADGLADGVVDDEPLAAELDEGQRREAGEGVLRRYIGQQRRQQREGDAAQDAGRVQRFARRGVEAVEVERGELLHDGRQHGVRGCVRALAHGRRRELQRERVAVDEAVDPRRLRARRGPRGAAPRRRRARRQRADGHDAQELAEGRAPRGAGRVARGHDDARVGGQRRQQLQAQPRVDEPQALGGVDRQHGGAGQRRERGGDARR